MSTIGDILSLQIDGTLPRRLIEIHKSLETKYIDELLAIRENQLTLYGFSQSEAQSIFSICTF